MRNNNENAETRGNKMTKMAFFIMIAVLVLALATCGINAAMGPNEVSDGYLEDEIYDDYGYAYDYEETDEIDALITDEVTEYDVVEDVVVEDVIEENSADEVTVEDAPVADVPVANNNSSNNAPANNNNAGVNNSSNNTAANPPVVNTPAAPAAPPAPVCVTNRVRVSDAVAAVPGVYEYVMPNVTSAWRASTGSVFTCLYQKNIYFVGALNSGSFNISHVQGFINTNGDFQAGSPRAVRTQVSPGTPAIAAVYEYVQVCN